MVESPAQSGRIRTLIHPGLISGAHVKATELQPSPAAGEAGEGQPGGDGDEQQPDEGFHRHHQIHPEAGGMEHAVADRAEGLHAEEESIEQREFLPHRRAADATQIQGIEQGEGQVHQQVAGANGQQKTWPGDRQHEAVGLTPMAVPALQVLRPDHPSLAAQPHGADLPTALCRMIHPLSAVAETFWHRRARIRCGDH
jgi:hypothetical protein